MPNGYTFIQENIIHSVSDFNLGDPGLHPHSAMKAEWVTSYQSPLSLTYHTGLCENKIEAGKISPPELLRGGAGIKN